MNQKRGQNTRTEQMKRGRKGENTAARNTEMIEGLLLKARESTGVGHDAEQTPKCIIFRGHFYTLPHSVFL